MGEHQLLYDATNTIDLVGSKVTIERTALTEPATVKSGLPAVLDGGARMLKINVEGAVLSESDLDTLENSFATTITATQATYPALKIYRGGSYTSYLIAYGTIRAKQLQDDQFQVDLEVWGRGTSTGYTLILDKGGSNEVTLKFGSGVETIAQATAFQQLSLKSGDHVQEFLGPQPQVVDFTGWLTTSSDLDKINKIYETGEAVEVEGTSFQTDGGGYISTNYAAKALLVSWQQLREVGSNLQVKVSLREDTT